MKKLIVFKNNSFIICLILLLLFIVGEASATTYYVATTGNNGNNGTSGTPWRTIEYGSQQLSAGDTLIVKDGIYTDQTPSTDRVATIQSAGTSNNWITIKAENKHGAIIDGNDSSNFVLMIGEKAKYLRIEGFDIKGASDTGIQALGQNSHIYFYQCVIHDNGRICTNTAYGQSGIHVGNSDNYTFDSCIIHSNGRFHYGENGCYPSNHYWMNHDHGIYLNGNNHTIINNIFYNNRSGWDIDLASWSLSENTKIINNTFADPNPNRDGHILIETNQRNVVIENNIFYYPKNYGIQVGYFNGPLQNIVIRNNLVYGATLLEPIQPGYEHEFTVENNFSGQAPLFVDVANRDYRIQPGSPAIDAGFATNAYSYDIDNHNRPLNSGYDIGAYEQLSGPPDTEVPSVPANLSAAAISETQVDLTWTASTDNVGVTGYTIYRDSVQIDTSTTTSYSDTGLTENTSYTYTVSAFDAAGNVSAQSVSDTVTTNADTTSPILTSVNTSNTSEVTVIFNEPVEQISSETTSNYAIDQGVIVSAASQGTDLKTITLTTSTLSEGVIYTLTVNNVKDQAVVPNTIGSNSQKTFEMNTSLYEAEDMNLISPMTLGSDTNASGGQYISPTSGTNSTSPQPEATLNFTVAQADTYYLWIHMMGPDTGSDALYVGLDTTWDRVYTSATSVYEWIRVETSHGSGNYSFNLTAGNHTFRIGHGEINARADALFLTNDANEIPDNQAADTEAPSPPVGLVIQ